MQNRFASTVNEFALLNKVELTNAIAANFRETNTDDSHEHLINLIFVHLVATSVTRYYYYFVYFSVLSVIFVKLKTWPTFVVCNWKENETETKRKKKRNDTKRNKKRTRVWTNQRQRAPRLENQVKMDPAKSTAIDWNSFCVSPPRPTHFVILPIYPNQTPAIMAGSPQQQQRPSPPQPSTQQWFQCRTPPFLMRSATSIAMPSLASFKIKGKSLSRPIHSTFCVQNKSFHRTIGCAMRTFYIFYVNGLLLCRNNWPFPWLPSLSTRTQFEHCFRNAQSTFNAAHTTY